MKVLWLTIIACASSTGGGRAQTGGQANPSLKVGTQIKLALLTADAPEFDEASGLWKQHAAGPAIGATPFGSLAFSLTAGGEVLATALVYASLGFPSDVLEHEHASQMPSPCTLELFEIETAEAHRRQGYATALITLMLKWLQCYAGVAPYLFARDTSGIEGLYTRWGFRATDPQYPHVHVIDLRRVAARA